MVNVRRLLGMETDEERHMAIVIRVVLFFLFPLYLAADEIRYSIWSKTAEASVEGRNYQFVDSEGAK